jgi:hypothetical protein
MARVFNRLYDLKMTIREEMELAYLGERTTRSKNLSPGVGSSGLKRIVHKLANGLPD